MRSPFAPIRRWFSLVLGCLEGIDRSLEGIYSTIQALIEAVHAFELRQSAPALPPDDIRLDGLATRIDDLTLAVKEGVNNVQRSERRVRAVVTSARRELADAGFEHPGLEAEHSQLREVDGEGGGEEQVPAVPEVVEQPRQNQHSVIAGVTVQQMVVARARRR